VAHAIYRVGWSQSVERLDDSWLRRHLADSLHEEPEHFFQLMLGTSIAQITYEEWQERVASCKYVELDQRPDCQVHLTIQACHECLKLIDDDWLPIADRYRPGQQPEA